MVLFRVTLIEVGMIGITLASIVVARRTTVERTHVVPRAFQQSLRLGNSSAWNG
jgi:Na+/H+ antiporter NhaB